jgi:TRAP-type uncharacterized transport system substrate-binding protein
MAAGAAALALPAAPASAQTYGLATMQPGTLAHTTGSAIAKVLKEKAGLNTLVQATAGESVLIPMVARGEIDLGIANLAEVQAQVEGGGPSKQADLRLIGALHPLWTMFWVRKDTTMKTNGDLKGKRSSRSAASPPRTSTRCWCRTSSAAPTISSPARSIRSTSR